jgi:hypothetical protein
MDALSDLLGFVAGVPAIVGLVLATMLIFLTSNWRLALTALLIQYLLVAAVLSRSIEAELVIVKILTGILAVAILYMSAQSAEDAPGLASRKDAGTFQFLGLRLGWSTGPLGLPVRIFVALAISLTIFRFYDQFGALLPVLGSEAPAITPDVVLVVFLLVATGLVGLVIGAEPLRVAPALLTILSGFDLAYTHLDSRLPVVGAYGAVILLVSLAFSYLILGRGNGEALQPRSDLRPTDVDGADTETVPSEETAAE